MTQMSFLIRRRRRAPMAWRLFRFRQVRQEKEVARGVSAVVEHFGTIRILINNAAIQPYGTVDATSPSTWDLVMSVNLRGAYLASHFVLPHMRASSGGATHRTTERGGRGCRLSGQRPGELLHWGGIQGRRRPLGETRSRSTGVTIMVAMQCAGAEASFRDGRFWTIDDAAVGVTTHQETLRQSLPRGANNVTVRSRAKRMGRGLHETFHLSIKVRV